MPEDELVGALALLVVLSSTAAMMIRLSRVQQTGSSIGILGARAPWAAESGVEWALAEAIRSGGCEVAAAGVVSQSHPAHVQARSRAWNPQQQRTTQNEKPRQLGADGVFECVRKIIAQD